MGLVGQFSSPDVLEAAWPAFLEGAGIDAGEPALADRVLMWAGIAIVLAGLAAGLRFSSSAKAAAGNGRLG